MKKRRVKMICLGALVIFISQFVTEANSQDTVDKRLDRIEAKLDSLISCDNIHPDTVGAVRATDNALNLLWGLEGLGA